ncbi:putative ABC transporter permease [Butyrivibrio sp. VCB2001]|uniref:putative ABC transporter permease n=1 Tax=Butyrivibrio sp. VCB2001 TaxID=1280667 RepID=UPI00047E782D|nr:putative ABC transporter permease [Butyrivibrio sp. VCB2001]
MKNRKISLDVIRNYIEYFLIYCFGGWLYESIWCDVIYHRRGFLNRGTLFGPWLPIYGIGFFIILGIFTLLKIKKPWTVFIVGGLIATIAEFIASYIMDKTVGGYTWNYATYFMNYKGRIALVPSLMFGLLICLAICVIHPAIVKFQNKYKDNRIHNIIFIVVFALFILDLTCRIWLGPNFKG